MSTVHVRQCECSCLFRRRSGLLLVPLSVLISGILATQLTGCGGVETVESEPSSRPVKMMTIESPAAEVERKFPAVARAGDRSDLSFRVSGTITEIAAVEGKEFSAGDVLARLDPRDFENRVAEAKSTLTGAEADLALLKAGSRAEDIALLEAQLAAASARAAQSQSDFNRQKQMYERGLIAKSEFEVSETTFTVASREMESASQQLAKARSGARPEEIQSAEARVESVRVKVREAEAALDDTFLRAPFDGLVGTVYVDQFQEIQGKQAVLSFQNIGGIELELQVPESLVLQRRAGGTHTFEVAFAGDTSKSYPAELRQFSTEADTVTQTYRLTLGMDAPPDLNVFPGMTAEVTVKVSGLDAGKAPLLVPVESVGAATDGSATIWLIDTQSMQVHSKPVKTGRLTGDSIEVLEGLQPGDTIATAGVSQLRDGMAVRPIGQ